MAQLRDCMCQICGIGFQHPALRGRRIQAYNLCEDCVAWHKYCSKGAHFPLRSEFAPAGDKRSDGLQTVCSECLVLSRTRILPCAGCNCEFFTSGRSQRHNGNSASLCDDCYLTVKYCTGCNTVKSRDEFGINDTRANGLRSHCRECERQSYHALSKEEKFDSRQWAKMGVSYQDYLAMDAAQGGRCAICQEPETTLHWSGAPMRLAIDHCHTTGKIRSLLCNPCNRAIGLMNEDTDRLLSAIEYIKKWSVIGTS